MALKPEWKVFIKEMNKTGDKIAAYLKAYPHCKSRKNAATAGERLLKNVEVLKNLKINPEIQQKAKEKLVEELKEELKVEVLEANEKRAILRDIALGHHKVKEYFIKRDGTVGSYSREPTPSERAQAIQIDNRMAGDDAPEKQIVHQTTDVSTLYKQALQLKDAYKKEPTK